MSEDRPAVPAALQRDLLQEAGYRCAIPACRVPTPLELAHIEPWSKVRVHRFENMIVLCRNDHFRFDHGEIPLKSIRAYKANLAVLNGRYSDVERRLLEQFAEAGDNARIVVERGALVDLNLRNLRRDGLVTVESLSDTQRVITVPWNPIRVTNEPDGGMKYVPGTGAAVGGYDAYSLTDVGRELVHRWYAAEFIQGDPS